MRSNIHFLAMSMPASARIVRAGIRRSFASRLPATATRRPSGVTLVELMLVVAILAVLAAIAVPSYQGYIDRANVAQAKGDIQAIDVAIAQYHSDHRTLPDDLGDLGKGSFIDPWGNPYQYVDLGDVNGKGKARKDHSLVPINSDYDLYSMGKDGRSVSPLTAKHSRDDVVRGRNGQFVGLASDF